MNNISSGNRDNLASSFPICIPFVPLSCSIALASTSTTLLKRIGDVSSPVSFLILKTCLEVLSIYDSAGWGFVIYNLSDVDAYFLQSYSH